MHCYICTFNCLVCNYSSSTSSEYCIQCKSGYELGPGPFPTCLEICGDSISTSLPCDLGLGVPYDGCDDNCHF